MLASKTNQMRAAILPDKLQDLHIQQEPDPTAGQGQAVVRLKAAGLNRRDWWIQQGQYAALKYPALLGSDGAGIVEAVGPGVNEGWVGKEVIINPSLYWGDKRAAPAKTFGILGMPSRGCLAEKVAVPAENLVEKPAHLTWEEAAALPLGGITVYRTMFYRAGLQAGERVLITGAGGGTAQLALTFAMAAGAEVWVTTSSSEKLDACLAAGAKGGVFYTQEGWEKVLKEKSGGFDVVIDSAGGPEFDKLLEVCLEGGRIGLYGGTAGAWPALRPQRVFWKQLSILGSTMGSPEDFAEMLAFVDTHKIKPMIGAVFSLDEAYEALKAMGENRHLGKIVVKIA